MKFSDKILNLKPSSIRKLIPFSDEAKKRGIRVYHLNVGQPDIKTPEEFFNGIKSYHSDVVKYAPSGGLDELKEAVSKYYNEKGMDFNKEDILVTNGGSEAYMFALMALFNKDEEILVTEPYYSNYNTYFQIFDIKPVSIKTKAEDGFHLPKKEEIEKLITNKTKAILISNPGNPTGTVYTEEEVKMLAEIALENDIFIIADEVYREFVYDDFKYLSFGAIEAVQDRVLIIDSISKRYSTCGARIGFALSKNKEFMKLMFKLCQARLAAPVVEQIAATYLYNNTPKHYLDEVNSEYKKRRDILLDELNKIDGVFTKKPEGAFYVMVKLPVDNSENFVKWLLTDYSLNGETIMMAPAFGFYSTPGMGIDEVRIAYVLNENDLRKSMHILKEALKVYPQKTN